MDKLSVAVLIDGGFFLKRHQAIYGNKSPQEVANSLFTLSLSHVNDNYLYRILYYDCWPLEKKAHNPITGKSVDFSTTSIAEWRERFFEELKKKRKVALRLGYVKATNNWLIKPRKTKELLRNKIDVSDLKERDVFYEMTQKGIDIKIGTDIASLALKDKVNRIVLMSGDSDFVPAAKLARREGIDFILDPMWNNIQPALFEHIDGLKSTCKRPRNI